MSKVTVIGGGASGIMAAIAAARHGAQVVILEHKDRIGKKILMTGNGKCNLSNLSFSIDKYYSDSPKFIETVFRQFNKEDTISFFKEIGLFIKDKNGYLYPMSEQASTVLDLLRIELKYRNVEIITACNVKKVISDSKAKQKKCGFIIDTEKGTYLSDSVILACGGKANPQSGSDGSGYELAGKFGHKVITPLPALVQLRCVGNHFKSIAGVRCEAKLLLHIDGNLVKEEYGELQLTEYGISGIPVFQLSRIAAKALDIHKKVIVKIDLLPAMSKELIYAFLTKTNPFPDKTVEEAMLGLMNKKLLYMLWKQNGIMPECRLCELQEKQIESLTEAIKAWTVEVSATNSFLNAQVCCGGVDCNEMKETCESRKVPGLFLTGELLDVDGICGGYNLQWAWSTGYIAGKAAAESK